ncbi:MAG TPA: ABC transporter permease subunit [Vicinamibacterales bacterium]|nr:ABC transporter permease subunit [Vicinamibacterales bacterium]
MPALLTIAHLTLHDARRRKILSAAAACGAVFLAVFWTVSFFVARDLEQNPPSFLQRQINLVILSLFGLYAANFLSVLLASLLPVDALSGEIDSGVMQTLASKPVRRADIVLGKWLGFGTVIVLYFLALAAGVLGATRWIAGYQQLNVWIAIPLMLLELVVMHTISIAGGTRLGTVTNGIMTIGVYGAAWIGGWVEQLGTIGGIQSARAIGVTVSLFSPADSMWRLAAYYLQPDIVRSLGNAGPFAGGSVPSALMVWWALGFTAAALAFAVYSFGRRQL